MWCMCDVKRKGCKKDNKEKDRDVKRKGCKKDNNKKIVMIAKMIIIMIMKAKMIMIMII